MKVVKLTTENIKRISAVCIEPGDSSLVTIGGKNGAGKSSVLDSISYALGGEKMIPSEPIRKGECEGRVVADLGDLIVTRRFYRAPQLCSCDSTDPHSEYCDSHKFGPTKSVLTVTNRDGAKYPSPQVLLDNLYGKLSFDPLAFSREKPIKQNEILRKIAGLDFAEIEAIRQTAFGIRAMHKKTALQITARRSQLPYHPHVGKEQSVGDMSTLLERGMALDRDAANREADFATAQRLVGEYKVASEMATNNVRILQDKLDEALEVQARADDRVMRFAKEMSELEVDAVKARALVPDLSLLNKRIADIDLANAVIRKQQQQNEAHAQAVAAERQAELSWAEENLTVMRMEEEKVSALENAVFPVAGLGLTDDGVTFEGLPLEEVSSSVQLRVSIAIGLALNPKLKVLLIRNGNLLDDDSMKLVAAQAAEAGAQVWMEYVTASDEGVTVMLEDGHEF